MNDVVSRSGSAGPVDPRELRVSDAEREHVVKLLQRAIGHGLLSLDEFTTRTDTALAARTRAELNAVLVDLPGLTHRDAVDPALRPKPVELRNTMSTQKRTGSWVVPSELLVHNKAGTTELDLTEARIDHARVHVKLNVTAGSVKLLLPEHATVDVDDVVVTAGKVHNKVRGTGEGRPHFVFTGSLKAGSLTIRQPTYVRIGAMVIRFPWKIRWES